MASSPLTDRDASILQDARLQPFPNQAADLSNNLYKLWNRLSSGSYHPPPLVLTEAQVAALEKAKGEKESHGEFESECPGYCGAQDTFYVGNMKGDRPHLSADFYRHLQQGRLRQAV